MAMAEKEYIEREAAAAFAENCGAHFVAKRLMNKEAFPAADVREVVRGKWETVMLDHERMGCRPTAHYCSECHHITWFRTFFCPNCGADMRQTGDENV